MPLALSGCLSLPQSEALRAAPPGDLPPRVELTAVPFFPDDDVLCGPATLATLLTAAGLKADKATLAGQVYLPGRRGSLQAEMLAAARRNGAVAHVLPPHLPALVRELAAGHPVAVLQNLRLPFAPVWHYAVAVGYDLGRERLIVRSGLSERREIPFSLFEFGWRDGGHWAMTALPPGRLPVTADEAAAESAVLAFARVAAPPAQRAAWQSVLGRWPDNLVGLIGLGGAEFALGDTAAAVAAYRRAAAAHPASAAAHHNLAFVLLERGEPAEAEAHAERALALGGPNRAEAERTLSRIRAAQRRP